MRVLCVAEKPSQARTLAQLLSRNQFRQRRGLNKYCNNFDFEYRLKGNLVPVTMTSVLGHVMEHDFDAEYRKWSVCDPCDLLAAPVLRSVPEKMHNVAQNVRDEARRATHLYIWTDCDREGEAIGAEVAQLAREANSRIVVRRAHYSAITMDAVDRAMVGVRDLNMREVAAVEARSELDLRTGAALTRLQTLRLQNLFSEVKGNVLSYGSCQFPTLGFVVDQFLKVENFVSEPFWFLHAEHTQRCEGGEDARVSFTWRRRRLFDQEVCFVIYAACMEDPTARVVKVTARPKEKWRPLPLTTVELQKAGSRHLRLSPDRVMTVAEGLYNKGLISYPRTETNVFDKSMDLRGLVEKQAGNRQWGEFARRLLDGEFRWPRQGKNNDNAHPPVHPLVPADGLSGDDARVYEFVCRRFLACCANNAKGHYTEVTVEIGSEQFAAEGLMVVARNYLDVYHPYERWEGSAHIPVYREGDTFMPTMFEMRDGATTAPRLLRYEDLVGLMEKNEIGTDATIHEHIKRVIERGYVHKQADGSLRPSTLGVALVEGYDAIGLDLSLCKPYLRRELELALKEICRGSLDSVAVKRKAVEMYRVVYQQSRQEFGRIVDALTRHFGHGPDLDEGGPGAGSQSARAVVVQEQDPAVFACPGCVGGVMRVRQRRDGRWMLGCSRYPACNRAVWMSDCVVGAGVSEATCGVCSISSSNNGGSGNVEGGTVYQLNLQFKPGSMPAYIGESYVGCLRGCDETLNQLIPSIQAMLAGNAAGGRCDNAGNNGNGNGNGSGSGSGGGVHEMASPFSLSGYALDSEAITATASKPKCHCGLFANRLTTRKEGSNFGRDYYKCSRQMRQCGFYVFADEYDPSAPQPGVAGGGRPITGSCYKCGQEGHWAKDCPNPGANDGPSGGGGSSSSGSSRGRAAYRGTKRRGSAASSGTRGARTKRTSLSAAAASSRGSSRKK